MQTEKKKVFSQIHDANIHDLDNFLFVYKSNQVELQKIVLIYHKAQLD